MSAVPKDRCWMVPIIAACANFLFSMPGTNIGLFYVLFMDKFCVSREAASWPRTIATVMSNLMGFIIGALQQKISIYSMAVAGAVLSPLAVIASALVPSIEWMMLTFGFFSGASEGALMITTSVYMVSYFDKYRSAAMGLKYVGLSASAVVGPVLLSALQEQYGFEGMFLVLGGLIMNVIPLVLLLRHPSPVRWPFCTSCRRGAREREESTKPTRELTERIPINRKKESGCQRRLHANKGPSSVYTITPARTTEKEEIGNLQLSSHSSGCDPQVSIPQDDHENAVGVFLQAANILRAPIFYALLLPIVAADFTLPLFSTTIVDYAIDKGVSIGTAAVLVTCIGGGGVFGRLVVPILSDKAPRGRCVIASVSFVLAFTCFIVMPHLRSFPAVAAVTVVTGIQAGYLSIIKAVLAADYMGVRSVPVSWGLVALVSLPLTFCEPSIVGLFRDAGGSYDNLYRLCGALDLVAALLLLGVAYVEAKKVKSSI